MADAQEIRGTKKQRVIGTRFRLELIFLLVFSVVLIAAARFQWVSLDLTEVMGFVTGAFCVWLVTHGNIWSWPN